MVGRTKEQKLDHKRNVTSISTIVTVVTKCIYVCVCVCVCVREREREREEGEDMERERGAEGEDMMGRALSVVCSCPT